MFEATGEQPEPGRSWRGFHPGKRGIRWVLVHAPAFPPRTLHAACEGQGDLEENLLAGRIRGDTWRRRGG